MSSEAKKIVSRTGIYGVGQLMRGLASFLMLPVYTRYLTPSDYGTIELLNMAMDLAALLFGARIGAGIFRFHNQAQTVADKKKVITTSVYISALLNFACIGSLLLFSEQIAYLLFGDAGYASAVAIFSLTLFFGAIGEVAICYLRIEDRPYLYVFVSFMRLMLQLSLNIYFIVFLEMAFWGVIYAAVLSSAAMALGMGAYVFAKNGIKADIGLIVPLIKFSYPIILASLAMFFIFYGDRYILRLYKGIEEVGLYALAYKFGAILFSLLWSPFMTYWEPRQYQLAETSAGREEIAKIYRYINAILVAAATGLCLFSPDVIFVMADPSFHEAARLVPFLVFAYVFQAWFDFTKLGLLATATTKYIAISTYIVAVIIFGLYMVLIPLMGAYGAGLATLIAMFIRFLLGCYWSQKVLHVPYVHKVNYGVMAVAFVIVGLCINLDVTLTNFVVKSGLYILFVLLIFFGPIVLADDRRTVLNFVRSKAG